MQKKTQKVRPRYLAQELVRQCVAHLHVKIVYRNKNLKIQKYLMLCENLHNITDKNLKCYTQYCVNFFHIFNYVYKFLKDLKEIY